MDTDGHIRYFCRVAVANNAAMNIGVHVSFSINGVFGVFFGGGHVYVLRNGIPESYDNSVLLKLI